jgi:hypothetical protein
MPRLVFITPPLIKPSEPGLSAAAAAQWFRQRGVDASALDASIGWYRHTLALPNLEALFEQAEQDCYSDSSLNTFRQTLRHAASPVHPLRRAETYADRRRYSSAANHLVNTLRLASIPTPGFHLRVADLEIEHRRPHCSADLEAVAQTPGPFDRYFVDELIPHLEERGTTHLAISLTFLNQAFAAFRLAYLLRERMPSVHRWLGGPLIDCWSAMEADLHQPAFGLFHRVFPTVSEQAMNALVEELDGEPTAHRNVLTPDLDGAPWDDYFVPMPTVPAALGRGCYWRRCTFCPDYLHPSYRPGHRHALAQWLVGVAKRFPKGAMLHLTDSALPPTWLETVADTIREKKLPLRWHGFVRMEPRFADPAFMHHLAEGGCAMLQWGLETASPRLLEMMDKGVTAEQARAVLRASTAAGIRNHAYLLFGLPTETDFDRDATLAFVQEEAETLHALNTSLLNLPKRSPMHANPERYGITALSPFGNETDLSLYDDFRCGHSHPRLEARHWLGGRFFKDSLVKGILGNLNDPFKENHSCFLPKR